MNVQAKHIIGGVALSLASLVLYGAHAQAQDTVYLSNGASQCDIFRGLSRELPRECQPRARTRGFTVQPRKAPKMRGIVFRPEQTEAQTPAPRDNTAPAIHLAAAQTSPAAAQPAAQPEAAQPKANAPLSISFRAEFEFNSARLTPAARRSIDQVGAVLNHELMWDKVIQIEGHADAVGSDAYNRALSEERARAVKQYLVTVHKVGSDRLRSVGKGESEPFDPSNPDSAVNRRVEFKNVTG